jgi:general secretion pathway protein G
MHTIYSRYKKYKWFTLVEMLIVIVIIGILAAALIPRLTGAQDQARDTARLADLNQIGTALAVYNADNNGYPINAATVASGATNALSGMAPTYIKSIPTDPKSTQAVTIGASAATNGNYAYLVIATGNNFVLGANTDVLKKGNINKTNTEAADIVASTTLSAVQANIVAGTTFASNVDSYFVYAN